MDTVDAWLRGGGIRKSLLNHRRKMKAHIRQAIIATMEKRKINRNMLANTTALLYFALISFSRMGGVAVSPLVVTDNIGGAFRCGAL